MEHEPDDAVPEAPQEPQKKPRAPRRLFTRQEKIRYFLMGFLGWWLVNIPIWLLQGPAIASGDETNLICGVPLIFGLNIFVLIRSAFVNRWIALGLLAAFAVNLMISLILGLTTNAICWIPFTTPAN